MSGQKGKVHLGPNASISTHDRGCVVNGSNMSIINPRCACAQRVVVCVCVCVYVCPLITAATHIGITQQRYLRVHSNTAIVLKKTSDFPKNASLKSYGVICLPRAAPPS